MVIKRVLLFFLLMSFLSCSKQVVQVDSASKRLQYPGIATGKTYLTYEIVFNLSKQITLSEVRLNATNQKVDFLLFSSQKDRYIKSEENLGVGSYILTFKTTDVNNIDNDDVAWLVFKDEGVVNEVKTSFVKKDPKYSK